jgi:hypothetical protein
LVDSLLATFTLALGALSLYALYPTVHRSHAMASDEVRAVQIAHRFIEHIQLLRPSDISFETLSQLNLIDQEDRVSPYEFTRIPMDESSMYSPNQTLRNGRGFVSWQTIDSGSVLVDVRIEWRSASGKQRQIQTGTIIGGHR